MPKIKHLLRFRKDFSEEWLSYIKFDLGDDMIQDFITCKNHYKGYIWQVVCIQQDGTLTKEIVLMDSSYV